MWGGGGGKDQIYARTLVEEGGYRTMGGEGTDVLDQTGRAMSRQSHTLNKKAFLVINLFSVVDS